jgi:hypothetical protein
MSSEQPDPKPDHATALPAAHRPVADLDMRERVALSLVLRPEPGEPRRP